MKTSEMIDAVVAGVSVVEVVDTLSEAFELDDKTKAQISKKLKSSPLDDVTFLKITFHAGMYNSVVRMTKEGIMYFLGYKIIGRRPGKKMYNVKEYFKDEAVVKPNKDLGKVLDQFLKFLESSK